MSTRIKRRARVWLEQREVLKMRFDADGPEPQIFMCGPDPKHVCDTDGPGIEGETFSSASCSVCGMSAMDRAMWDGP